MRLDIKERLTLLARGDNLDLADIVCADAVARIEALEAALREVRAALFEPEERDAYYNLCGALIDIERHSSQDKPPDAVCISTIKRVLEQLAAANAALAEEQDK